jgi:RNA polymerase sigma-70 factor (ECF subfamily)
VYSILSKRGVDYAKNSEALVMQVAKQKIYRHYALADRLKYILPIRTADDDGNEVDMAALEVDSFSLEDTVVNQLLVEQAVRFLESKPLETRKIFTLFYSMQLSIPEIARFLGISESGVKNRLYRTCKELRAIYT